MEEYFLKKITVKVQNIKKKVWITGTKTQLQRRNRLGFLNQGYDL